MTAYVMLISDWSSEVCSSDLPSNSVAGDVSKAHMGDCCRKVKVGDKSPRNRARRCTTFRRGTACEIGCGRGDLLFAERGCNHYSVGCEGRFHAAAPWIIALPVARSLSARAFPLALAFGWSWPSGPASFAGRSEEHTSELQSLMRISYAA